MRGLRRFVLLAILLGPQPVEAITGDKAEFRKIAEDVYAFVGKLNDANAMALLSLGGVGCSPKSTQDRPLVVASLHNLSEPFFVAMRRELVMRLKRWSPREVDAI